MTIKGKQPDNSTQFVLRMYHSRNKSGIIGLVRRIDESDPVPFSDFCDLRDKVRELMKGKRRAK
jgi:hypothetical protein